MTWLSDNWSTIAPLVGVAGNLIGNSQQSGQVNAAANRTLPFSSSSDQGTVNFGNGTFDASMNGSPFSALLQQLATAGAANYGSTQNSQLSALDPSVAATLTGSMNQNQQAANGAFGALNNLGMDPTAAADNRYKLLTDQAAPGEARARSSLEERLFQQGRLGTSGGGVATEALGNVQSQANLGRQMAGADYALGQQSQLAQLASQFSGNATNAASTTQQLAGNSRNNMLNGALQASGGYNDIFAQLLQQGQLGISAGGGQGTAAQIAATQAQANGVVYGNAFNSLLPAVGGLINKTWGTPAPNNGQAWAEATYGR